MEHIQGVIGEYLEEMKKASIKEWKKKVAMWHTSSPELYAFIRNPAPAKACMVLWEGRLCTTGADLYHAMQSFWGKIESWPSESRRRHAEEALEDYCRGLPFNSASLELKACHLKKVAHKASKRKAPGLDGWTIAELARLPTAAWAALLRLLERGGDQSYKSLLAAVRRVPLDKGKCPQGTPNPSGFRPVDVFSGVVRILSSAQISNIKGWILQSLDEGQFAMQTGTQAVAARAALCVDKIVSLKKPLFGCSLDFSRLFNTLCPHLAAKTASRLGLKEEDAQAIVRPITQAKHCWRFPRQEWTPWGVCSRGVPQGLSGSVALSEIFLSLLMRALRRTGSEVFSFVDDIHIVSQQPCRLRRALDVVEKFTWDFALDLSGDKTTIWGSDSKVCEEIAAAHNMTMSDSIHTMGAEWVLKASERVMYKKEVARLSEAKQRMERMQHVKAKLHIKASAIQIAITSLLAYLPHPVLTEYNGIRTSVKRAMGQLYGSWEVYVWVLNETSLDVEVAWVLALLCLWRSVAALDGGSEVLGRIRKRNAHSRLTAIFLWCRRHGWSLDAHSLAAGDSLIPLAQEWSVCRRDIVKELRTLQFAEVEKRRPLVYGGLSSSDISIKAHRELCKELTPYDMSILHRIWCGVALTLSHKHSLDRSIDPMCPCNQGPRTMGHLLWECPLAEPPDMMEEIWRHAPPFVATACLCPSQISQDRKSAWRSLCLRAVRIMGSETHQSKLPRVELREHVICFESSGRYAYCAKCYTARRLRDYRWICLRVCRKAAQGVTMEGDYLREGSHVVRLIMRSWRGSAIRPFKQCVLCGLGCWAKDTLDGECAEMSYWSVTPP